MDENECNALSRREVVGGVGISMAAAGAGPTFAQEMDQPSTSTHVGELTMEDRVSKYPKPPFRKQTQPWPGLARDMDPRPDHGEASYRGSGRLSGRQAIIAGGDSGMGRAAAIAYAREGADVAINYIPSEEPDAREVVGIIQDAGRRAVPIPGDLRKEAFGRELIAKAVSDLSGLDILVCNAGRQQARESILDISTEDFDATMKTNISAPFWLIKAALPHLKP